MLEGMCLIITVATYAACFKLYKRKTSTFLNPILTTMVSLIVFLLISHIRYGTYSRGTHLLTWMLNPATVAFAIPLYKHYPLIKKHAAEIGVCLLSGAVVALCTSLGFARSLHLSRQIAESLAPRSITTPIAMDVSHTLGGIPILTATFVIMTALVALIVGPLTIRWLGIRSSMAKGILLGASAHGMGTSMAFEIGQIEGTFASLSMILVAGLTMVLGPLLSFVIFLIR